MFAIMVESQIRLAYPVGPVELLYAKRNEKLHVTVWHKRIFSSEVK
jgi:hypothetical protein